VSFRLREQDRLLVVLLIAIVVTRVIGGLTLPVYDDAFITYRYAVNLAEGRGFTYQPNEWILGITTPLFGLLAAAVHVLRLSLPVAVPLFNLACDLAIAVLTYRIVRDQHGPLAAALFGCAFALSPMLVRISVGGMEVDLFLLATLCAFSLYARGHQRYAVALAAVTYFLRPEGVLAVGVLCLMTLISRRWRDMLIMAALALLVVAPGLLVMHHYYGSIIPHSVVAKANSPHATLAHVVTALVLPNMVSTALLLVGALGFSRLARSTGVLRLLLVWGSLYLGAYCLARPLIWSWYSEPVQYLLCVLAGVGVAAVLERSRSLAKSRVDLIAGTALAGVVALWLLILVRQGRSGVTHNVYAEMREFFQQNPPGDAIILAEDIGAVGYYSRGRIYDAAGLVTPDALRHPSVAARIAAVQPRYLLVNADRADVAMMRDHGLLSDYKPVRRFSPTAERSLSEDPREYPAEWAQSYIWFERSAETNVVASRDSRNSRTP
jgi:hypothetical protein